MGAAGKINQGLGRIDGRTAAKGNEDRRLEVDSCRHGLGDAVEMGIRHDIVKNLHLIRRSYLAGREVDGPGPGQEAVA